MLGLYCCVDFSLVVASRGYSPAAVRGLLIAVAPLVAMASHCSGSRAHGLNSCSSQASEHRLSRCGKQV